MVAFFYSRKEEAADSSKVKAGTKIPWFIGLFILASLTRMAVPALLPLTPTIAAIARTGLTITLFLIGAGISRATLRATGWKAVAQGIFLWAFMTVASLAVVRQL
jgi:uncharacterized membrane protein YadS